jgi:CheY-like chemotaxis protein
MEQEILVVNTDSAVLTGHVMALKRAGYAIGACTSFSEARRFLNERPSPDLLLTDVKLGPYNGLHLVAIARVEHPRTLAVVIGSADQVLEGEARGLAARYVEGPISGDDLVTVVVDTLMVPRPRRRWPRKRPTVDIPVVIDGVRGRVLDVSYGGIGVEVFGGDIAPDKLEIVLPDHGVDIKGQRVWSQRLDPAYPCSCGIALPAVDPHWRMFVDDLQVDAVHE